MFGKRLKLLRDEHHLTMEQFIDAYNTKYNAKMNKSTLSRYENNLQSPLLSSATQIAEFFGVSLEYLQGGELSDEETPKYESYGIKPIRTKKVPMLGEIACGEPITCNNEYDYVDVEGDIQADFCVTAKGDSMINARIHNGDLVFARYQSDVDNGEIAVVIIDDSATLKRVYKFNDTIELRAENPMYKPLVYANEKLNDVRILGKAIAFQSKII